MSERDAPVILEHEGLERRPARHELKRDCLRSPDRCFLTAGEQPIAVMALDQRALANAASRPIVVRRPGAASSGRDRACPGCAAENEARLRC